MDDSTFIISNSEQRLHGIEPIDFSDDTIGTVTLLKITTAEAFMNCCTFCEGTVSVQRIDNIEKKSRKPSGSTFNTPLSFLCDENELGLYRFNENWYEGISETGIPFYVKNSRGNVTNNFLFRTLDFFADNISAINVIKKSNSSIYIETTDDAKINEYILAKDSIYKIDFSMLDRSSNNGEEYFMQKSLIKYIPDYEEQLYTELKSIISDV